MVQGKINRGRHTDHPAGHHSIWTNQCSPPPSPIFLQGGCPSCRPTNSVKALKAKLLQAAIIKLWLSHFSTYWFKFVLIFTGLHINCTGLVSQAHHHWLPQILLGCSHLFLVLINDHRVRWRQLKRNTNIICTNTTTADPLLRWCTG